MYNKIGVLVSNGPNNFIKLITINIVFWTSKIVLLQHIYK